MTDNTGQIVADIIDSFSLDDMLKGRSEAPPSRQNVPGLILDSTLPVAVAAELVQQSSAQGALVLSPQGQHVVVLGELESAVADLMEYAAARIRSGGSALPGGDVLFGGSVRSAPASGGDFSTASLRRIWRRVVTARSGQQTCYVCDGDGRHPRYAGPDLEGQDCVFYDGVYRKCSN